MPVTYSRSDGTYRIDVLRAGNPYHGVVVLKGENNDFFGERVNSAGDINGDEISDVIIGSSYPDRDRCYVVFGSKNMTAWGTGVLNVSNLDGRRGFALFFGELGSMGVIVSSTGDINGDGLSDIIIARGGNLKSYVVFGSRNNSAWGNGVLNITSLLDGRRGFALTGPGSESKSHNEEIVSVSNAGDINGDGVSDFVVGIYYDQAQRPPGKIYVIFGSKNSTAWGNGVLRISSLMDGQRGFALHGELADDYFGVSVSNAGDINADGIADLMIGEPDYDYPFSNLTGKSYIVLGSRNNTAWGNGVLNISRLINDQRAFVMYGELADDHCGRSVSSAGDVNGDRISDIVIGAYGADFGGKNNTGKCYIIFGSRNNTIWSNGTLNISDFMNGQDGVMLIGEPNEEIGRSVSSAGDINNDGLSDTFIKGSRNSYVVFGGSVGGNGIMKLSDIISEGGAFKFNKSVLGTFAGDINGDARDDLLVGDSRTNFSWGEVYLIWGGNVTSFLQPPTASPTHFPTSPTRLPTSLTQIPTLAPTKKPTQLSTQVPTYSSTKFPTSAPTGRPTQLTTKGPTFFPTLAPIQLPTLAPTEKPTQLSTQAPTQKPTETPTLNPTTNGPSLQPTQLPSHVPTLHPTQSPNQTPTSPPTLDPAKLPTPFPSFRPTQTPTPFLIGSLQLVVKKLDDQCAIANQGFSFSIPKQIFNDSTGGKDITLSAYQLMEGIQQPLPNWLSFCSYCPHQFSGYSSVVNPTTVIQLVGQNAAGATGSINFNIKITKNNCPPDRATGLQTSEDDAAKNITGNAVGGVFGALGGAALLLGVGYCYWKKRHRANPEQRPLNNNPNGCFARFFAPAPVAHREENEELEFASPREQKNQPVFVPNQEGQQLN